MRLSLRARLLLLVGAINLVVFAAGLVLLTQQLGAARNRPVEEFDAVLDWALRNAIPLRGELKVAEILRWPQWAYYADAIIVDSHWRTTADGEVLPVGVHLNPVGSAHRAADFDRAGIMADVARAVGSGRPVLSRGGLAVPVRDASGGVWGGCWYRREPYDAVGEVLEGLLPWFLASTLLLTLGTFVVLRRLVVAPVEELAGGAREVARGNLAVRLREPPRRDELSELIRGFNAMAETVQGFNARLESEVERATEQARRAEAAAMTQRRLAATGELAAGIAHEINNPLGGLQNAVDALARPDLPPERRERYHALLRDGLERIRQTVGQVLRFTPRQSRVEPVDLLGRVRDAVALVRHRAEQQGVELAVVHEGDGAPPAGADRAALERRLAQLPPVLGEANELNQAVLNLLVNALDALEGRPPGAGHVTVALGRVGDELRLAVSDDGPGVSAQELERVSDLFYTTKEAGRGSGLGLSFVHNVASSHGGRVQLTSAPGAGFCAELFLPPATPPTTPGDARS